MKNLPPALQSHLATGTTTLAWCWRITRADNVRFPAYTRDCAEAHGRETLLEAARRHLVEVPQAEAQPGDVLIFRWRRNTPAKHCAILSTPTTMIHALEGAPVSEVPLSAWWKRHFAGTFCFPGIDD